MRYRVTFRPSATKDLDDIYEFIATDSARGAHDFTSRIHSYCEGLGDFPKRGMSREEISPGLRTIGFERRALIAFRVLADRVQIVRIFYGGRDFERLLRTEPFE